MQIKIFIIMSLGFLFLGLGAIGLLLPVWPTTPFVLVSAACFSYTPHMRKKIMKISFFREHIENYEYREGLSRKTIMISLGYLWGMMLLSMVLLQSVRVSLFLFIIAVAVTIHILWMSKAKDERKNVKNFKSNF